MSIMSRGGSRILEGGSFRVKFEKGENDRASGERKSPSRVKGQRPLWASGGETRRS